jgi:biotin synthase
LFDAIHPGLHGEPADRIAILKKLKGLGYETGSGIMIGLPGQSYESVARDICLFQELNLDMIGIGPFIAHPETPLGNARLKPDWERLLTSSPTMQGSLQRLTEGEQVPNTELMVYKAVALTRLVRPDANIPSTSALATINKQNGRELGLQRGANVVMPNLTPLRYRRLYEIYPAKACIDEPGDACGSCLRSRITVLGRHVGHGPGGRKLVRNSDFGLPSTVGFRSSEFSPCPLN